MQWYRKGWRSLATFSFALGLMTLNCRLLAADEGMWTFDNPPLKQLKERYGFTLTQEWLDHVRLASIRFNDGGSGSFVSPHGLALTNHHVALGQLQKVSTAEKDYAKDGFFAHGESEEMKCPDLELNVLESTEDVTARVLGAVKPGMSDKDAIEARKAEMARIEKESLDATKLRSDVISLYQGGEYWLYRYRKYTDVRLVFAPEQQIAFFGGDPDNFTYPRYDIDFAIFRAYEDGKPADTPNYLKWNDKGPANGDLVFVSGNPESTSRLDAVSQLETVRDYINPEELESFNKFLAVLQKYSALGTEQQRQAMNGAFFVQGEIKRINGMQNGLLDKSLVAKRQKDEGEFRARVEANPEWKQKYGGAWEDIQRAQEKYVGRVKQRLFRVVDYSGAAYMALTIVQYVVEVQKPDGKRLDGFHDSQLDSLKFQLFSPAPVYPQMEEALLSNGLALSARKLGPDDPFVQAALGGRSPQEVVHELISGTKIGDFAFRKSLVEGGEAAVAASTDPMVAFARRIDPSIREIGSWVEDNLESVETEAGEKLGQARFAAYGKSAYPDATFTLRLSYGTVIGYPMNGTEAPYKTTLYGLYERSLSFDQKPPFDLPEVYRQRQSQLDLATPVNFVNTCDIVSGNSGSPVINREGELVGLIFDLNIEGLVGDYVYDEARSRAVAVDTAVMIETMRKLYGAGTLADELEGLSGKR
ncbi:MAG TPA: S46 family peptidase [Terriglobia bacterium]|nr:S46 family peptidase [Terriglobia bacterium]